jgi:nucleotide-binding universal stress UspA family protein
LSKDNIWPLTVVIVTPDAKKADALSTQVEEMNEKETNAPLADCEIIIFTGKEQDEIMKYINAEPVELMVMGAYGHNRLRELLLGSTTSQIIRKSPIPVLLIR